MIPAVLLVCSLQGSLVAGAEEPGNGHNADLIVEADSIDIQANERDEREENTQVAVRRLLRTQSEGGRADGGHQDQLPLYKVSARLLRLNDFVPELFDHRSLSEMTAPDRSGARLTVPYCGLKPAAAR